eukprot:evm.model.NODE_32570_length_4749_cov_41.536743.2
MSAPKKVATEHRSIGKSIHAPGDHTHVSDTFYDHEGRLAKKSIRVGNMENDDHDRALERTMREVNKASIALNLRSQGSLGRGEGAAPGLDGVFSKPEAAPIHIDTDENDPAIHHLHSDGLSSALAAELLKKFGRNELPEKTKPKWRI